jgi:hypothetical protein
VDGEVLLEKVLGILVAVLVEVLQHLWGFIGRTDYLHVRILIQLILSPWIFFGMDVGTASLFKHQLAVLSVLASSDGCGFFLEIPHELNHTGLVLWVNVVK